MAWPLVLGALIACGAGWLLVRPVVADALSGRSLLQRLLVQASLLGALALVFFALRLAPLGAIALVLAGSLVARAVRSEATGPNDDRVSQPRAGMTRAEALSVLGLDADADAAAIEAAHRRMIVRAHPDRGGSDYMAAKVNEARAVLRGGTGD